MVKLPNSTRIRADADASAARRDPGGETSSQGVEGRLDRLDLVSRGNSRFGQTNSRFGEFNSRLTAQKFPFAKHGN
jgi:hypothetical protein